jgi:serine/threonine-protein kinase RsbT
VTEPGLRLPIGDEATITHAVLETRSFASGAGFNETDTSLIVTALSELAHNIRKYAKRGEVVVRTALAGGLNGIEIVASDRGPGIANVEEALQDHFSSSGTLGLGLPGVRRMMDEFEIESQPGEGTRVTVRKWL